MWTCKLLREYELGWQAACTPALIGGREMTATSSALSAGTVVEGALIVGRSTSSPRTVGTASKGACKPLIAIKSTSSPMAAGTSSEGACKPCTTTACTCGARRELPNEPYPTARACTS